MSVSKTTIVRLGADGISAEYDRGILEVAIVFEEGGGVDTHRIRLVGKKLDDWIELLTKAREAMKESQ